MIELKTGNIIAEDAEALINTVNCVGIMGRGIALQFRKAFPANYEEYEKACNHNLVQPGRMFVHETNQLSNPRYIINFPTKRHWRGKSHIEDIVSGLKALVKEIRTRRIRSIAIPPLGSGLGGLDWRDVKPLILDAMSELPDVKAVVFEPNAKFDARTTSKSKDVPSMTTGRAALIVLLQKYVDALLEPYVTLLEAHKLMYFMQEAGEGLKLRFTKAQYGPYAENLRHVLTAIEGHFISGYADGGDAPDKELEIIPGAARDADHFLDTKDDTRRRFERVTQLVKGFETPFGLELLATVHWIAKHERTTSLDELTNKVYAWNDRKRQMTPRQIELAYSVLKKNGWLSDAA
ncbi:MAG: macro domain-containing protein [Alphaproteobacteria bacterium]|nr:macro domain-containing protein [Alphaproteobacteria bacterium]MBL6940289.1 macro domain-containing protein [Alphaproteobacteria bacterium]MBL7099732.1 macro domain-containing protein [Alphaproteobacteria bacterium]